MSLRSERGSVLIMAVIGMLTMGVLSISFSLLAQVETRIGVNYKQQGQAEALAEAGLERARDTLRGAALLRDGFTDWFDGTTASHNLHAGVSLGPGSYSARLDNDCAALGTVPASIEEGPGCTNTVDDNTTGVITAWAQAGVGRARIRAIVGVDYPWKHVCSDATADNNGYCNDPTNMNGNPTVIPADPSDPHGPAAYDELPRPLLGCSRVAPGLHRGSYDLASQTFGCAANSEIYSAPYPAAPPRFVVMGEDPAVVPGAKTCNDEPAGGNDNQYFGYFDCALTTYCDPSQGCGSGGARKGCLPANDSRVIPGHANQLALNPGMDRYVPYDAVLGQCGAGGLDEMGMVFVGDTNFNQNVGSMATRFDAYVLDGTWTQTNNRKFYGTLVVEGNEVNAPCSDKDVRVGGGSSSEMWTGPDTDPPALGWGLNHQYGYPLVLLVYNPDLPAPTVSPTYAPQGTCADMGSANSRIYGMVYSGGHVQYNPLSMSGTVVAFEIQTQGSASYTYSDLYGKETPPPGFPLGEGNQVVIIRKSFVVCTNYSDETGGPTACN